MSEYFLTNCRILFQKFNILNQSKMLEHFNLNRCLTMSQEHAINNCIYHGNKEHIFIWKLVKPQFIQECNLFRKTETKTCSLFQKLICWETDTKTYSYFEQRNSDFNMKLFIWKLPNLQFDLEVSDSGLWTLDSWTLDSWTLDT